jgi:hypothetical protein
MLLAYFWAYFKSLRPKCFKKDEGKKKKKKKKAFLGQPIFLIRLSPKHHMPHYIFHIHSHK